MKSINLIFPGEPRAIQSVRVCIRGAHAMHYQPKKNEDWKSYIRVSAQSQLPKDWTMIIGPVAIGRVLFLFSPIKGLSKSERMSIDAGRIVLKDTKPDMNDNLFKGLMDALEGIVYINDSRTCRHMGEAIKGYHKFPRIEIELAEVKNITIPIPPRVWV